MDKTTTLPAKKKKRKGQNGSSFDSLELFLLHLPTTIWYLVFCYAPMFGVIIAFKNYKVKMGKGFFYSLFYNSDWCGFDNFKFLFQTNDAIIAFRNTVLYNIVFIILGILIPVTLALMMNQLYSKRFAKVCQTMMFLPHFISWVVVSYFVYAFLSTDKGLVNRVLASIYGADAMTKNWYMDENFWIFFNVFLNVWKGVGYSMVVYLATITGIDGEMYEAALIDGASKWQQTKYITLPMLRPIISIMFIMAIGSIFKSDFGLFYQANRNSGALVNVTQTLDVYVYKALLVNNNIKFSSAAGLIQSVFGCILIIISNTIVKKIDPESGMF